MKELQRLAIDPAQWHGGEIQFTADQDRYLRRVLRLEPGDQLVALLPEPIGDSRWWLVGLGPTGATALKPLPEPIEPIQTLTLLAALPKGSGFDEVVRQATELGVTEIVPVLSDRTLMQPNGNRLERWRRIAREAAEQSERAAIPTVTEPLAWPAAIVQMAKHDGRFLCVARRSAPHLWQALQLLADPVPNPTSAPASAQSQSPRAIALAVGPEGGWTSAEVDQALAAGWQVVSLGGRVLRAVTAPLAALAIVNAWGETIAHGLASSAVD
ncbi:16S rRNA (uracil(1498)-N(3))-methyltransferase [Limnothrix sp. FACHB-881]|uniref:16S rRNA (uracil(1498)-N(3))-methyltransferase n=1 Tax=Limnothrix sp. FACHB-881 TaxID=2692819 RepID=UPI0016862188|nr:16S rRNA (uracil(1498)-N(3))-methyltransferase [Limnothrix sp. FACHB-881]MBD2636159.1 16S rRNA (uracil(1498)-N(3))-methyltransferase [Limnothrix sp. FACHB-881]